MNRIQFDEARCTACGACAVACMDQNDIDLSGGQPPYRRILQWEEEGRFRVDSLACRHCAHPACVSVCPKAALYRNEDTGLVLCHTDRCVGCRLCAKACPHGVPAFGADQKLAKCNGCAGRIRAGLPPACTRACVTGALTWAEKTGDI